MNKNFDPSKPLSEIMHSSLSKSPQLAEKQRHLLQVLSSGTSSAPPAGSTNSASPAAQAKPSHPSSAETLDPNDPNRPETEEDGLRAGALRLLKARHQSLALTGRIPASLQLPSSMRGITGSSSPDSESTPAQA